MHLMATLMIRDLPDDVKRGLRVRAAQNGRSMQEEARTILRRAVVGLTGPELLRMMEQKFGPAHGVDLELPPRERDRPPPDFSR